MIKVNAIELEFEDGATIMLSLAEAKILYNELKSLFGDYNSYLNDSWWNRRIGTTPNPWIAGGTTCYSQAENDGTQKIKIGG